MAKRAISRKSAPRVSVIIPAHNEEAHIDACLESLKAQTAQPFQVIIVNDASTDGTAKRVQAWKRRWPVVSMVTRKKSEGYTYAIVSGYRRTTGDIIAILDADSVAPKTWLASLLRAFQHEHVTCAGGSYLPKSTSRLMERIEGVYLDFRNAQGNGGKLAGTNMAFSRRAAEKLALFENVPTFSIDKHIQERFRDAGDDVRYLRKNQVLSEVPATMNAYWRQWFRWGKGMAARGGDHVRKTCIAVAIILLPFPILASLFLKWELLLLYLACNILIGLYINAALKKKSVLAFLVPEQKYLGLVSRSLGYLTYKYAR